MDGSDGRPATGQTGSVIGGEAASLSQITVTPKSAWLGAAAGATAKAPSYCSAYLGGTWPEGSPVLASVASSYFEQQWGVHF